MKQGWNFTHDYASPLREQIKQMHKETEEAERRRKETEEAERRQKEAEEAERKRKDAEVAEKKRQDELVAKRIRYDEIFREISVQMQLIAQNKGWFGKQAQIRKEAQNRLGVLQAQLTQEFPNGKP